MVAVKSFMVPREKFITVERNMDAQTAARITFVENRQLLADYGGVVALLRFRI